MVPHREWQPIVHTAAKVDGVKDHRWMKTWKS